MKTQDDSELDRRMRAAFEPDAESIGRVIAAAVRHRHKPITLRVASMLAIAAILLIAVILRLQSTRVHADCIKLEYVGNVALLEFSNGSSLIVTPGIADQGPTTCLSLIILEGDTQ
jgi:hypothetical protein